MVDLDMGEIAVMLTKLIPLERDTTVIKDVRKKWEQQKLNGAIRKLEAEHNRQRIAERKEKEAARETKPAAGEAKE